MDAEKRLLLLQLKSDLKEVLGLTREKSDELLKAFRSESDKVCEKAEDLEYYISSMLDLTREIKALFDEKVAIFEINLSQLKYNQSDFEEMLTKLSNIKDTRSLKEILNILETWEHYELCAKVNEKLKSSDLNSLH